MLAVLACDGTALLFGGDGVSVGGSIVLVFCGNVVLGNVVLSWDLNSCDSFP